MAGDDPHLLARQRDAARGDHVGDTRRVGGEHVEVALDDHGGPALLQPLPGLIQPEKGRRLVVDAGLGGVEVLGDGIPESPATEAEHLPPLIRDGEDQAVAEVVAPAAGQPRLDQLGEVGSILHQVADQCGPGRTAGGSEADPETSRQRLVHAALGEQPASRLPAGQAPEHVLVELGGAVAELDRAAPGGAASGRPGALLQLDPGTLGEDLQGAGEVDPLDPLDEGEDVAPLVAAVAVKHLPLLADREARGLLRVEGAEADVLGARAVQRDVTADHIEDVEPGLDLGDGVSAHRVSGRQPRPGSASCR